MEKTKSIRLEDIFVPAHNIIARKIEGELIIVPIESGAVDFSDALYTLNETGQRLWEKLSPGNSIGMIAEELSKEYNAPIETIQQDMLDLIRTLADMGIIARQIH